MKLEKRKNHSNDSKRINGSFACNGTTVVDSCIFTAAAAVGCSKNGACNPGCVPVIYRSRGMVYRTRCAEKEIFVWSTDGRHIFFAFACPVRNE